MSFDAPLPSSAPGAPGAPVTVGATGAGTATPTRSAGDCAALARSAMEPRHGAFIARVDFIDFLSGDLPRSNLVALSLQDGRAG